MADSPSSTPVSFSEFEAVTTTQWQERIRRDLKGQDPATLTWNTPDGLTLEPFYHREALDSLGGAPTPLVRTASAWRNVPTYTVPSGDRGHAAISRAAEGLRRGADGAHFLLSNAAAFDVGYLHQQMPLHSAYVGYSMRSGLGELVQRLQELELTPRGFVVLDPITCHAPDMSAQFGELRKAMLLAQGWPEMHVVGINSAYYADRGATITQQIAFALATAATYLSELPKDELTVEMVARSLHLHVGINPNYFFEIAKLRALRRLFATLLQAYGVPTELAQELPIFASTSSWSQTTLDPHTNLLRVTTEAMSAVLGGATAVSVGRFDSLFHESSEFSERLARNLPILLREEAYMGRVQDPAAGSYYLETLTDQLSHQAWTLFQKIEAEGGLPGATGLVLQELHASAQAQFRRIANGEQVVVGTNKFQNPNEQFDYNPKRLLRSREFDSTRATYPTEVLRLATAMHFDRRERKKKRAALVLLGAHTNQHILESFLETLPRMERPELRDAHPESTLSVLFSSAEEATLMYATPEQFGRLARAISHVPIDEPNFLPPALLTADLPTMQEAIRVFGFKEFTVQGYSTEDVLARLQGKK
ncbi:heterodimeric methylmalonyl-CoA mutase small subunit [Hymenobacter gelipurpurascens]|uniref:Heterodimeric methylmalonyl-CoA mutase small subunit n=1 Tax=Hymenobacter gelipurpurascens TaxID=89968 RepID=A0A212U9I8_9BACT|nr:methylmalonyl-CoA mutase family protein [Hymenobacter gelipurpurascens]SNC74952.1 heterodimeric methylmalonyl-CoA mutase small subunit [Hymenobacter gelipurpurascens]